MGGYVYVVGITTAPVVGATIGGKLIGGLITASAPAFGIPPVGIIGWAKGILNGVAIGWELLSSRSDAHWV